MKTSDALALAQAADPAIASVSSTSQIATLWAGMGQILRLQCQTASGTQRTLVAKRIRCKNPRSIGDRRKAASYRVEAAFYSRYSTELSVRHICCRGLHVQDESGGKRENKNNNKDGEAEAEITIVMTPLPHPTIHYLGGDAARAAVRSVARLHAHFWGGAKSDAAVRDGLAAQGTYWYLDTRPDEYDAMPQRGLAGRLKQAARGIDEALKAHPYQTVCHGDLKSCNMSRSADPRYVCLVDFQYVGKACCAKDLAYLFVCGVDVDSDFEESQEEDLLRLYVDELKANGVGTCHGGDGDGPLPTIGGLKGALDLAYCDLYRWMLGWGVW